MTSKQGKSLLSRIDATSSGYDAAFSSLCSRRFAFDDKINRSVEEIVAQVRDRGDSAVREFTKSYDGISTDVLEVSEDEWASASSLVDLSDRQALERACQRIKEFHEHHAGIDWESRESDGSLLGQRSRPMHRVGLYVPGGKASYPSSVLMNAIPAAVARVPEIFMTTPPQRDGTIRADVLHAAKISGVNRVFKAGGAQAIAALAFGTETIPKVDKIVGPGNVYVQAAKILVFGEVGIDSEAGPTEVLVVADHTARPSWIAADLLSQAEHDELACAVLVTHDASLVTQVEKELQNQLRDFRRQDIAKKALAGRSATIISRDVNHSVKLANDYAAEHLVLAVERPDCLLESVENAGTVFLGHYSPVAIGDYLAGPNHVLPTGGTARFFSPLGVEDFVKRTSFVGFQPQTLRNLGQDVIRLSNLEGLPGHGASVMIRLEGADQELGGMKTKRSIEASDE